MEFCQWCKYLAELMGTAILIIFGVGVVANIALEKSKGKGGGWLLINFGWGLGVMIAVYACGWISGGHINPAITIAFAVIGLFPWSLVPGYIIAQVIGGFLGACVVYLCYKQHFDATEDPTTKRVVFCTIPEIRNYFWNGMTEAIGTGALVLGVLAIVQYGSASLGDGEILIGGVSGGLQAFIVGLLVLVVGSSLGGPTGYAINPARDLGPRLAHAILPIKNKAPSDWAYGLTVPILGPIVGGIVGALVWKLGWEIIRSMTL